MAHEVMIRELRRHPEVMPLMIILTDGAGNVSMTDLPPQEEAHRIARLVKESGIRSVVINTEHEAFDRGLAAGLARSLGGDVYTLRQLKAEEILETVRGELNLMSSEKK